MRVGRENATVTLPRVDQLLDLADRVAIVTGASGTIGAGIARRLHEAGASVAVHCLTGRVAAEVVADDLGARAVVVEGDVERDAGRICAEAVAAFGRLDVVVNNAGLQPVKPLLEISAAETAEMLRVNVGGVAAMTRAAAAHLPRGGSIVNIASIEGLQPAALHSHYTTSKAAVLMQTRAAALELGPQGIRVNAVAPGLIRADGIEDGWPEGVARWHAACPLGRMGEADDVADAVLFLASDAARWVTGATLVVDGGVLTNNTW